jgi:hypothetical protein
MSMTHRIESLKSKHAEVEKQLHMEEIRPMPDETVLYSLKKQKLQIKDELQSLGA